MKRSTGYLVLLILSLLAGLVWGELYYRLVVLSAVPRSMMSTLAQGSGHMLSIVAGLATGALLFLWVFVGRALMAAFRGRKKDPAGGRP